MSEDLCPIASSHEKEEALLCGVSTMVEGEGMSDVVLELRSERERLVRHIESWRERVIALLDSYEATIGEQGLDEAYRRAFAKCRRDLLRAVQPLGLDVIEPKPGDPFDEGLHRIVGEETKPGADASRIQALRRSGYRIGSDVLRHADVVTGFVGVADDGIPVPASSATRRAESTFEELQRAAERNAAGTDREKV